MADSGLLRFLGNGIRFAANAAASTYVGLRILSSPASNFYLNLPTTLPGSTSAVTVDTSGNIGYQALGGGGTVTSVALSLPSIFSVSGSPVTTTGTLSATLASQTANAIFAAPNGSAGAPTFRSLVSSDIPQTLTSNWITDFNTAVRANRLDQLAVPTASLNLNSQKITGLLDPTNAQDATTKAYVDAIAQGLDVKPSVRVASTANVSIASPGTAIDGVTLSNGDRVLLKNQTTGSQNGIYVFNGSGSALTRAVDSDTSAKVTSGLFTFAEEGTANADSGWFLVTDGTITLGTTSLAFTQFSGAGQITAGAGLTKTGNTLDVIGTSNRISVAADSIDIDAAYVGQTSITTVGTIATGTWSGTAIAVAKGGTGSTTAAAARAALGVPGFYRVAFTNADLTGGVLTMTHGLGQKIVAVQISDNADKVIPVTDDVTLTSTTQCTVDLTSFGTLSGTWNAIVTG